ncbi:MAG: preprotein translocase subunit SecE [Deltaproteobacteria bacterium]|nr:preprotein translocase subunit SecE [Deltaproteobacteria bacterium]MBW2308598.1 preprotein translocase subunit SecE [Deltaproteobacteria bacterium]
MRTKWIEKIIQFFREVRTELKKVTWPSRKETIGSTSIVIIFVLIIALYLGLVDLGLTRIIRLLMS